MPDSIPIPCKLRRGAGGSVYWWDGSMPPTVLSGGVGGDLNAVAGPLTVHEVTVTQFDSIAAYCYERLQAFFSLGACETCPIEQGKSQSDARELLDSLVSDGGDPHP